MALGQRNGAKRPSSIVSLAEAARKTGRNPEVLRRWCTEGRIPAIRIGRTWAISLRDAERAARPLGPLEAAVHYFRTGLKIRAP